MTTLGKVDVILGAQVGGLLSGFNKSQKEMKKLKASAESMQKNFLKMSAVFTGFGGLAVKTAAGFEQGMARVAALTGSVGSEFDDLTDTARRLAAETKFTATETADAMGFMAMAGFDSQKIMKALPGVLELSSAAMMEVGSAADIATNIMSGFGVEAEDLGRVNDVLVKALTSSNVDLGELGQAMKFIGPVAKGLGISIEETAASLGALGDAGIKGGIAGRQMRGLLMKMIKPGKEATQLFRELGVSLVDDTGKFIGLTESIRALQGANLTTEQSVQAFGESASALGVLMTKGADDIEEFTAKLKDSGGVAKRISERQMATLSGEMKKLGSSFEDLQIIIGNTLIPAVSAMGAALKSAIDWFRAAPVAVQDMISALIGLGAIIATSGLALAFIGAKMAALSLATTGAAATISGGLAVAFTGLASALVPLGLALAGLVIAFKGMQTIMGDSTPLFATISDAMDRAAESAHGYRTTLNNLGMAVGDAALKIVTLNGLFGLVDMDRLTDMSERSAIAFSDASFEAENFGGSVEEAAKKTADAAIEIQQGLEKIGEELDAEMSLSIGVSLELEPTQSLENAASAAAVKAQAAAAMASKKFKDALNQALKDRGDEEFEVSVAFARDKVLRSQGRLSEDETTAHFEEIAARALKEQRKNLGQWGNFTDEMKKAADSVRSVAGELADGISDSDLALTDTGARLRELAKGTQKELAGDEIAGAMSGFSRNVGKLRSAMGEAATGLTDAQVIVSSGILAEKAEIEKGRKKGIAKAKEEAQKAATHFADVLAGSMQTLTSVFASDFLGGAKAAISAAAMAAGAGPLADAAFSIVDSFVSAVTGAFETAFSQTTAIVSGAGDLVVDLIGDSRLSGAVSSVAGVFDDVMASARDVGGAMVQLAPFAALAAVNLFNLTVAAVGVLGMLSPFIIWGGLAALALAALAASATATALLVAGGVSLLTSTIAAAVAAVQAFVASVSAALVSMATAAAGLLVVVGLVGAFAFLATKTKALAAIQDRFGKSVDRVVDALEPLVKTFDPLTVLFDRVVSVLIPFAAALGAIVGTFQGEIFNAVKFLAVAFATLAIAGITTSNALLSGADAVLTGLSGMLGFLGNSDLLADTELGEDLRSFGDTLSDAAKTARGFQISTEEMEQALQELQGTTLSGALAELRRQKISDTRARGKEGARKNAKDAILGDGFKDASDAASGLAESLTNVPEGFKVARARFEAIDPVGQDVVAAFSDADMGADGLFDVTTRITGILSDFADKLGLLGSSSSSSAAGGGFPLPSALSGLQASSGGGPRNVMHIGKIVAVDPEDAANRINRIMESRNFQKFDSPTTGPFTGFSKA